MRSEMYLGDAEPKLPSTPPSNPNRQQRTNSRSETPPSLLLPGKSESLLKSKIMESSISPTTLPRRPRKGSMVRQMAFSYGSPKNIRMQKSLNFRASLGSSKSAVTKLFPGTSSLNIDKELGVLFEDSTSTWLPISNTSSPARDDHSGEHKEHNTQESPKKQLCQSGLEEEHLDSVEMTDPKESDSSEAIDGLVG